MVTTALEDLAVIREELNRATDRLLELAERGLATAGPDTAQLFAELLEACAFGDLLGQRLSLLAERLAGVSDERVGAELMNGPAPGGLDQAATDQLFGEAVVPR